MDGHGGCIDDSLMKQDLAPYNGLNLWNGYLKEINVCSLCLMGGSVLIQEMVLFCFHRI
jgi:hypothetical protein